MRTMLVAPIFMLLLGCAAQQGPTVTDAVDDFIRVGELEDLDVVRTTGTDQFHWEVLSDRYIILRTRKDIYLAKFVRRCHAIKETRARPDIRHDPNKLRARFDTIRGCRIDKIYSIDKAQAEELKYLGKGPRTTI